MLQTEPPPPPPYGSQCRFPDRTERGLPLIPTAPQHGGVWVFSQNLNQVNVKSTAVSIGQNSDVTHKTERD